ncbi:MAG: 30S ribosomal protein S9 [Bacteroidales bacterium]|nr:30S ribosomal protein S9 [Bacteroidales bacterium]
MEVVNTIGRRKAAIARIYMKEGNGAITINHRAVEDYFPLSTLRYIVNQPFEVTETEGRFDVNVNLTGGGFKGQAEALRLAIARALCEVDKETYRPLLKAKGFMHRDPRVVERKKPGQPKARKRFQFSKR